MRLRGEELMNPYERLVTAIVKQACDDYESNYRTLMRKSTSYAKRVKVSNEIELIEAFFLQGFFEQYTGMDGKLFLETLKKKVREGHGGRKR